MTQATSPRVSVGLPVRNGQKYLRSCIDSILAQTFTDFELIVCDNASTDATESICRAYTHLDPRVSYIKHAQNLGPPRNYNSALDRARGEYFHWQAHDDMIEPTFLQQCVESLDADPTAVVAYARATVIDDNDQVIEPYEFELDTVNSDVCLRFRELVMARNRDHRNYETFGLMRSSVLREVRALGAYAHADRVHTVRMAMRGRFARIEPRLFLARWHAAQSMQQLPKHASRSRLKRLLGPGPLPPPEWWNPSLAGRICFPDWNLLREYIRTVYEAPLTRRQRMICYGVLGRWLLRYWPKLVRDIVFAMESIFNRTAVEITEPETEAARVH